MSEMLTALECIEDADRLRRENRAEYARTPRWRWLKRSKLDQEWLRNAEYRQRMVEIRNEDAPYVLSGPDA